MQVFLIFYMLSVVFAASIVTHEENEKRYIYYMDVLTNCTIENGITVEKYAHATKDNNTDGVYDKTKCVDACMFKVHKILKDDGTIDFERAIEHLLSGQPGVQRDIMRKNIETCSMKKEDNDCDTAHNLMICALGYM